MQYRIVSKETGEERNIVKLELNKREAFTFLFSILNLISEDKKVDMLSDLGVLAETLMKAYDELVHGLLKIKDGGSWLAQ